MCREGSREVWKEAFSHGPSFAVVRSSSDAF